MLIGMLHRNATPTPRTGSGQSTVRSWSDFEVKRASIDHPMCNQCQFPT